MKRNWLAGLAVALTTVMVGSANAQTDWNQSTQIGSYQSIMSRAGYRTPHSTPSQQSTPAPIESAATAESAYSADYNVATGQPVEGCNSASSGSCGDGCGTGYVGGCNSVGVDGGCSSDVYAQTSGLSSRLASHGCGSDSGANHVFTIRGLFLRRDHEDDVRLTRNGAGDIMLSTDADMGTMGGIETILTRRNSNGNGFQIGYWGLYPGQQNADIYAPGLDTYLGGFNDLSVAPGAQNLLDFYNNAESNHLYRENFINNIEVNLLRNAGNYTTRTGGQGNFELLGGFRWFQFNENFGFSAFNSAGNPTQVDYEIFTKNALLGFQLGGLSQICLSNRMTLTTGAKLGLFNNRIRSDQRIIDSNDVLAYQTASGVDDYDHCACYKNDLSMLGELDFGLAYRMSNCARATIGYRVVGISGIALAPDQIPNDFTNVNEINSINSNGDLILGGGYAGFEFCY